VFADVRVAEDGMTLPHPGLHQRNFVLYPLAEIAAELLVPGLARVCRLRERVAPAGIERLAGRGSVDD
jgi:2-amino-4-hydroxy-6-hydroxymethyldihydropteridine diphosphokinase